MQLFKPSPRSSRGHNRYSHKEYSFNRIDHEIISPLISLTLSVSNAHKNTYGVIVLPIKESILFLIILLYTVGLAFLSYQTNGIIIFDSISEPINKQIVYQSTTLFTTFIFLSILYRTKRETFLTYFKKGDLAAEIIPEPYVGISPKEEENWVHIGKNFAVIISLVTTLVMYFQIFKTSDLTAITILSTLPFGILFALSNSFVEEIITRLGVIVVFKDILPDRGIALLSGSIFGSIHYFGTPGGVTGVFVAGFLGWFLCKSILETKGIFWAWLIHFLQDVIIFSALLTIAQ